MEAQRQAVTFKRLIGEIIYNARKYNFNYSQEKLAELTNTSVSTISRIERGQMEPSASTLIQLCRALDIKLDQRLIQASIAAEEAAKGN